MRFMLIAAEEVMYVYAVAIERGELGKLINMADATADVRAWLRTAAERKCGRVCERSRLSRKILRLCNGRCLRSEVAELASRQTEYTAHINAGAIN